MSDPHLSTGDALPRRRNLTAEQRIMVKIAIDKKKRAEIEERKARNAEFALVRKADQERARRDADPRA